MSQFKDKIPLGIGKVEYIYHPQGGFSSSISGQFRALYQVAISMDAQLLLAIVPPTGYGQTAVYPQPSVLTFIQSDEQLMWGRNCPFCQKYFRTNHILHITFCPYCSEPENSLAFISQNQRKYITACYDTFVHAYLYKRNASLELEAVTDKSPAWHYSEEKLQLHFKCATENCGAETDILGMYGYCPRCGHSNSRKLFFEKIDAMLKELEEVRNTVTERPKRDEVWNRMTKDIVSEFEFLGNHLRQKLLPLPMTKHRRKELQNLSFQKVFEVDEKLKELFDISLFRWAGNDNIPQREISPYEIEFVKQMVLKRHVLTHTAIADRDYLDKSGETSVREGERITVRSNEAKRFITNIREMALNLLDNVEFALVVEG